MVVAWAEHLIFPRRLLSRMRQSWSSFFGHRDRSIDCRLLLEGIGWRVAQFGVQPHAVVEGHDVVGDVAHGLGVIGLVALPNPLGLKAQEKALHHRVVPAAALAAHAADRAVARKQRLVQRTLVLGGFNRSSQHRVADQILGTRSRLRPASSSRAFFGVLCSARGLRLRSLEHSTGTGQCPSGSIAAEGRWCSRSCRAATGCEELRRRPSHRTHS